MKARFLIITALAFVVLTSCTPDPNDTSPTDMSTPTDTDVAGDPEADSASDANSNLNDLSDAPSDGDVGDTDALGDTAMTSDVDAAISVDATSDADATDTTDATIDADVANIPDVTVRPSVVVTAPASGTYTMGQTLNVEWSTTNADEVTLSLVAGFGCPEGEADVVVPDLASFEASTTAYAWEVPTTLAPGEYRVRVRASALAVEPTVGCSPAFLLQQPPGCESLGCASQNRACSTDSGTALCGGCVDGFADSDGICAVVDCGSVPAAPPNATLSTVSTTRFGGVATYVCSEGYSIDGVAGGTAEVTRRCGAAGIWESASGTCALVECGEYPAPVTYASLQGGTRTTFGGQASYSCATGYVVAVTGLSSYTLTCSAAGSWGTTPTCEPVDCGELTNPVNGTVSTPAGTTFGATAGYSCDAGYSLSGGLATRTCGATGSWGTVPTCNEIDECMSGAVCAAPNNVCANLPGSWQCSCAVGSTGATVVGGDATCVPGLGAACTADSECAANSWCSTVSGYRRCSPRVFSGKAHQLDFVFVPSGIYEQGTLGATDEERPYTATISRNYFVSRTEVMQGQWNAATVGANPSYFQNTTCVNGTCSSTENANNYGPVEQVDWFSSLAYANWLSVSQGLDECYTLIGCFDPISGWHDGSHGGCTDAAFSGLTCTGYRLLTESEWERAARGNTTSTYYWGEAIDMATVGLYAWDLENAGNRTQAVGSKQANAFGLYDMSGNVWEWVWDWVSVFPEFISYPSGSATDYIGPSSGTDRGIRGGSWGRDGFFGSLLRSASRRYLDPSAPFNSIGFRLARTAY